ncbi:MAG: hypothetical protein AAB381_01810 [Patescibacteria group bacterium]
MDFDALKFNRIKEEAESFYKSLGEIYCPYFKEKVSFNRKGFEHLKFIGRGQARSEKDQFQRFRLLHLAPQVLGLTTTIQGVWNTSHFEEIKSNSRVEFLLKNVTYYEFISVLTYKQNLRRVRIIVKQVENSSKYFWSIIPDFKNKIGQTRAMGLELENE